MWKKLEGKKTYICAGLIGLLSAAKFLGWIDEQAYMVAFGLLTGGGLASLRAAKPDSPNQ